MTPATCQVRSWTVFGPGYHKDELYSPERVKRIGETFRLLFPRVTPRVKLGHHSSQALAKRLSESFGFPAFGKVTNVEVAPDGMLSVDLDNVPTLIGGLMNSGVFPGGSIETLPAHPDPDDASKTVDGPVMTGIALLGEEQPAVNGRRLAPPVATFSDGNLVPPADIPPEMLAALAETMKATPKTDPVAEYEFEGQKYAVHALNFSQMTPIPRGNAMNPDQIKQELIGYGVPAESLEGLSVEELQSMLDAKASSPKAFSAMKKSFAAFAQSAQQKAIWATAQKDADGEVMGWSTSKQRKKEGFSAEHEDDDDDATPPKWFSDFAEQHKAFADRLGNLETAVTANAGEANENQATAMSAEFGKKMAAKLPPNVVAPLVAQAKQVFLERRHGNVVGNSLKAFEAFTGPFLAMPDNAKLKDSVQHTTAKNGVTGEQAEINAILARSPMGEAALARKRAMAAKA